MFKAQLSKNKQEKPIIVASQPKNDDWHTRTVYFEFQQPTKKIFSSKKSIKGEKK